MGGLMLRFSTDMDGFLRLNFGCMVEERRVFSHG